MIYQCLRCKQYYGSYPGLKAFPKVSQRYTDCDIWRCPYCKAEQDSRDIQTFLGVGGRGSVRTAEKEELDGPHHFNVRSRNYGL